MTTEQRPVLVACPKCRRMVPECASPGACYYPPGSWVAGAESVSSNLVPLPTWEECKKAVDADRATPLQAFIYENEPALTEKAQDFVRKCIPNYSRRADEQFRGMLADLIAFVRNAAETPDALGHIRSIATDAVMHDHEKVAQITRLTLKTPAPRCTCSKPEPALVNHGLDSLCEKCGQLV